MIRDFHFSFSISDLISSFYAKTNSFLHSTPWKNEVFDSHDWTQWYSLIVSIALFSVLSLYYTPWHIGVIDYHWNILKSRRLIFERAARLRRRLVYVQEILTKGRINLRTINLLLIYFRRFGFKRANALLCDSQVNLLASKKLLWSKQTHFPFSFESWFSTQKPVFCF